MRRQGRRLITTLICVVVVAMLSNQAGARSAGIEANTLTAACTGVLTVIPNSYTPRVRGTFTATLRAPCAGLGFAYDQIQIAVERYDLRTGAFKGLQYKNCFGVATCSMPYSFTGGPDRYLVDGSVVWNSTTGPWLFATPGVVVSAAPFCYATYVAEWPVTPIGPAAHSVGCNLISDLAL